MGFEFDLQIEVDRKAFAALEHVINDVDSGRLDSESARCMLPVLQTAFSGILEDNKGFHALLSETDKSLANYPKLTKKCYFAYYREEDMSSAPAYIVSLHDCSLKIIKGGKVAKTINYEIPFERHQAVIEIHNKFIKSGLYNLCS